MQTTLNKIKSHEPCEDGWNKLLRYLDKTKADDEPLELRTILESNGLDDTLWALRTVEGHDKELRQFAADCAELALPKFEKQYPNDNRPRKAIQAARDYADGLIGQVDLDAAKYAAIYAASKAAMDTAWAARDAARAAKDADNYVWAAEHGDKDEIKQLLLKYI